MKYIHAIKGGVMAFVIFALIAFFVPGYGVSDDVKTILTVSTFLFAIIVGFFIARFNSRYDTMRELIAGEDASWLTLYENILFFGKSFQKKFIELIDKYYIVSYDCALGSYYKYNAKYFHAIYDEMRLIHKKVFSNKDVRPSDSPFGRGLIQLQNIEQSRNKSSVLTEETMTLGQWTLLIILAGIVIFSIFYLRVPEFYSQVIAVLLSTALILVLLTLRDLQNLKLGGKDILVESGQEILEVVGKLRYYSEKYLNAGTTSIPANIKKYRLGLHNPGEKFNIKVVNNPNYKG